MVRPLFSLKSVAGEAIDFAVGNVTLGAEESDIEASIRGTAPELFIDFVVPPGIQVEEDRLPEGLRLGNVDNSVFGSEIEVNITGDAPYQLLNFVIPRGVELATEVALVEVVPAAEWPPDDIPGILYIKVP